MNRIYQGRVTRVEVSRSATGSDSPWGPAPGNDELLWQHHALFQDAVNYYLVALLALAAPSNRALGQLRQRIAAAGDEFQIWGSFRRRGANRRGLRESVAPYLTPGNSSPTLEEAFAAVLHGSKCDAPVRSAAVSSLLEVCNGAGAIQQQGRAYWPKFCDPTTAANFAGDPVMLRRKRHQELLPRILYDPATRFDSASLDEFDAYSIATPDSKRPTLIGKKAQARLLQAIALWQERRPESGEQLERLKALVEILPAEFSLPGYVGSSAKGEVQARLFALLLFKHVERSAFTFDLLRTATPLPRNSELTADTTPVPDQDSQPDPIRLARGSRGYVFRAFTSLPCWNPADSPEPQWKEFDIAAFKYALTALNQIEEKTKERALEAGKAQVRLDQMHGKSPKRISTSDEEEPPPVIIGDPRIERLKTLLSSDSLQVTNALTDGATTDYGLQPRTIRGFRDLRKLWRQHLTPGESFSELKQSKLREELREFQTEHSETIGSVALFEALLAPENWLIWQEPTPELATAWAAAGFAIDPNDPLTALVEERELQEKLVHLAEPIRLTPADPVHSRRQYDLNAVTGFSTSPKSKFRHEPQTLAFTTELAVCNSGVWRITPARLVYSAPRLLRDGLRGEDGTANLAAARWLQPMMEALAPAPELPQDLTDCAVCLMPDITVGGDRRVLLNFPIKLTPDELVKQLGREADWADQFCSLKEGPIALRWPTDGWPAGKESSAWFQRDQPFTVLGIDLGTRDAGAIAHLTVTPHAPLKSVHRVLGEAGGKTWCASLTGTQLIRLPGEDAKVFTAGEPTPVTEPFGERGRLSSETETFRAAELIRSLGGDPEKLLGPASPKAEARRFFSLQNDKLLVALRRAQARLARLQSLSWRLRTDSKRDEAITEIGTDCPERTSLQLPELIAAIDGDLLAQRDLVAHSIAEIANRVVPLRGRRWVWIPRDDGSRAHWLCQTDPGSDSSPRQIAGQRGLSHERLEQLEELRRRCQSLSRALSHQPGEPVRLGRSTRGDELPDPCPDLLEKIEHLRDQRVDQTAHAILAAALGVRLRAPTKSQATRSARDIHGEYERFRDPVAFMVIEDLSRYLSSQDRARRENTRLMRWCHRQLVAKLRQLCETYGIPVLATPAAYSSRFCSRSGAAGFRAVELAPSARHEAPWRWTLARLAAHRSGEKKLERDALTEAERVGAFFDELDRLNEGRSAAGKMPRTLLAPIAGGPVFVPLGEAPAMQADLNAAINIALRGIAAPDCHAIHQRLKTERTKNGLQLRRKTKREKARWPDSAPALTIQSGGAETDRTPNLFIDVGQLADFDKAQLAGIALPFATGRGLWTAVKRRAWSRCDQLNRARIAKWQSAGDDIPM